MKINLKTLILLISSSIQNNKASFMDEPDSDGDVHDKWDEVNDALEELDEALESFESAFDTAVSLRPSLGRANINISR